MATVGIATPHGGLVRPELYRHMSAMMGQWQNHTFVHCEVDTMIVAKARTILVDVAHKNGVDVLWFVDDDVLVPPNGGVIIDQAIELGVVSGLYMSRRPPFTPQAYTHATEPEFKGMYWPIMDNLEGTRQVDAVGAGCLCVRMDVFSRIVNNWKPRVNAVAEKIGDDNIAEIVRALSPHFEFLDAKGEDFYFCERCYEIGQPVYCNFDVHCVHVGDMPVELAHFVSMRDAGLIRREEVIR